MKFTQKNINEYRIFSQSSFKKLDLMFDVILNIVLIINYTFFYIKPYSFNIYFKIQHFLIVLRNTTVFTKLYIMYL